MNENSSTGFKGRRVAGMLVIGFFLIRTLFILLIPKIFYDEEFVYFFVVLGFVSLMNVAERMYRNTEKVYASVLSIMIVEFWIIGGVSVFPFLVGGIALFVSGRSAQILGDLEILDWIRKVYTDYYLSSPKAILIYFGLSIPTFLVIRLIDRRKRRSLVVSRDGFRQ